MTPLVALLAFGCGSDEGGSSSGSGGASGGGTAGAGGNGGSGGTAQTGGAGGATGGAAGGGGSAGSAGGGGGIQIGPLPVAETPLADGTIFAAPNGSGTACTKAAPCDLWAAVAKAAAGDVVFLRGGTYPIAKNLSFSTVGTASAPVTFESHPGEWAILDGSQHAMGTGVYIRVTGKFVRLRRMEVTKMPMQGVYIPSTDNLVEGVHAHHNALTGFHIYSPYDDFPYGANGSRNVIRSCTANDNSGAGNFDPEFANGGNSDGISISSGTDNRVENCLVYHNSDDGIDTWRSTNSYVGYTISHSNGIADGNGQGVKAGGQPPAADAHVEHCLSYSNVAGGFDFNSGKSVSFVNNTSWDNASGYYLGVDTTATSNIAGETTTDTSGGAVSDNSWQRPGSVTFVSTDPTSKDFLRPTPGGGFEDIGAWASTK